MISRVLLIIISIMAIALVGIAIGQSVSTLRDIPSAEDDVPDLDTSYLPPEIERVEESDGLLLLSGQAEPGSSLVIQNSGDRIRTVPVGDDGVWSVSLPVDIAQSMDVSVQAFLGDISLDGDQTVMRVPAPGAEDGIAQRALVLLTSPGGPSRIIQTPFGGPATSGALSVSMIEYDASGGTIIAGVAGSGGEVRVTSNSRSLGVSPVAVDGRWFTILVEPEPALRRDYTLTYMPVEGDPNELRLEFLPLGPETALEHEAGHWQVKRTLSGGGHQVTAVFASPAGDTEGNTGTASGDG